MEDGKTTGPPSRIVYVVSYTRYDPMGGLFVFNDVHFHEQLVFANYSAYSVGGLTAHYVNALYISRLYNSTRQQRHRVTSHDPRVNLKNI